MYGCLHCKLYSEFYIQCMISASRSCCSFSFTPLINTCKFLMYSASTERLQQHRVIMVSVWVFFGTQFGSASTISTLFSRISNIIPSNRSRYMQQSGKKPWEAVRIILLLLSKCQNGHFEQRRWQVNRIHFDISIKALFDRKIYGVLINKWYIGDIECNRWTHSGYLIGNGIRVGSS